MPLPAAVQVCLSLLLAIVFVGTALARDGERPERAAPDAEPEPVTGLPYEVEITGVEDTELEALLSQVSQLVALAERPPASRAALERRAEADLARFRAALRSEGYYASRLDLAIDDKASPVKVTAEVEPGTLYLLADYQIRYVGASAPPSESLADAPEDLGLTLGMAARAPAIAAADKTLLRRLAENGFPLAAIVKRDAVVDHALGSMTVALEVDAGPRARFGPVTLSGLESVEADYVLQVLPWQEGETYDQRKIDRARLDLSQTELFESISIQPGDAVVEDNRLPIAIGVSEREHRAFGGGATVSTDEGVGGSLFWEHRNIFGRNERLLLSLRAAEIEQQARADIRKPRFLRPDQNLLANGGFTRRDNDAFQEETISAVTALERSIGAIWRASAGLSLEITNIDDKETTRDFFIVGLPLSATRDTRDDPLNPTRGSTLTLALTPFTGTVDENIFFTRAEISGSGYLSIHPEDEIVLAGRARLGTLFGEGRDTIPANKRLYAGGGGSVRGFEFQRVGPIDADDDPEGGRSVLELSGEVRFRVFEDFGVVPFIDAGTVSRSSFLDFEERFLVAAGLGLRYFTAVGPLRFDIAFPLNGRDADDSFEIYVSLGQAF